MARIALDAMGGDFAPRAAIEGALMALGEFGSAHTIQLVGRGDVIRRELDELTAGPYAHLAGRRDELELVEAADVVEMGEKPTAVLRRQNSSMFVGLRLQPEGRSDAFVSAGNTGAQMAASTMLLKLHGDLKRPAISTIFPSALEPLVVLDSGANVDCSPEEMVNFARLGSVYAEDILGRRNPSIGLLSIGEEAEKGNAMVKEANVLLRASGLNFQGNVEGRDLPKGASERGPIDVVVCDGFVGNVLLKFYEALAPVLIGMVAKGAGLDKSQLQDAFAHLDYTNYGGAPLLGVRGTSIIAHGSSSPKALKNALRIAARAIDTRMDEHIGRRLAGAAEARPGSVA